MEEGCNLPYDDKDQGIIEDSIEKGRDFQIDPILIQQYQTRQIYVIKPTRQPGEEGFDEKKADEILSKSEIEKPVEREATDRGFKYTGNTHNGKGALTNLDTYEIQVGIYDYYGGLKTAEEAALDYAYETKNAANEDKYNHLDADIFAKIVEGRERGDLIPLTPKDRHEYVLNKLKIEAEAIEHRTKVAIELGLDHFVDKTHIEIIINTKDPITRLEKILKSSLERCQICGKPPYQFYEEEFNENHGEYIKEE
jgi:hypothetical protein